MKQTLTILLFALSLTAYGQKNNVCDYTRNEYDPFLKIQIKETTEPLWIGLSDKAHLTFQSRGDSLYAWLTYSRSTWEAMVSGPLQPTMFILENDSVITLRPMRIIAGEFKNLPGYAFTIIEIPYKATRPQIEMLSRFAIKAFRLYLTDTYVEHKVKQKNSERVVRSALCILNN